MHFILYVNLRFIQSPKHMPYTQPNDLVMRVVGGLHGDAKHSLHLGGSPQIRPMLDKGIGDIDDLHILFGRPHGYQRAAFGHRASALVPHE